MVRVFQGLLALFPARTGAGKGTGSGGIPRLSVPLVRKQCAPRAPVQRPDDECAAWTLDASRAPRGSIRFPFVKRELFSSTRFAGGAGAVRKAAVPAPRSLSKRAAAAAAAAAAAFAAFVSSFSFSCELFQFAGEVLPKILGIERRGGKKGNSGTPLKVECCDSGCSFPGKRFAARTSPAVAVVVVVDGEGGRGKDRDTCGEALLIHGLRHYHCLLQDGNGKGRCVRRKRDFNSLSPPSFRSPSPAVSSPLYLLVPCLHASEHALLGVLQRFPQCRQPCAFGEKRDRFIMFAGRL